MAKWFLVCATCGLKVELAARITTREEASWEFQYHSVGYPGHDVKLTAQPNPKRKRMEEDEPNGE